MCAACRVVGKDDSDVADLGHDRIRLIRCTLFKSTRVNVDIGDNFAAGLSAMGPKFAEASPVYLDNAGLKGVGIDVVVEKKLLYETHSVLGGSQEECAAFSAPRSTFLQFIDACVPNCRLAEDFRPRP
jgi:hypothetical protein